MNKYVNCWIEEFDEWIIEKKGLIGLPMSNERKFNELLLEYSKIDGKKFLNDNTIGFNKDGKLIFFKLYSTSIG